MDENTETPLKFLTRIMKIQNTQLLKSIAKEIDVPEEDLLEKLEKVKKLIFKVMALEDFGCEVSNIANSISESIKGKRSRELATIALAEVMIADKRLHDDEQELVILITELWDTEDILQDYLNDS